MVIARIDDKGRIALPTAVREELGLQPGDVLVLDIKGEILRIAKASNPFDTLIDDAIEEERTGGTVALRDFAESEGFTL